MENIVQLANGLDFCLALNKDGEVWSWGTGTGAGRVTPNATPGKIVGLSDIVRISAGQSYAVALTRTGDVWAWRGGPGSNQTTPVQVSGLNGIVDIDAGKDHVMAIKSDGAVWGWGRNDLGQLGDGTNINRNSPVALPFWGNVVSIRASIYYSIAIKSNGGVVGSGWGMTGVLGVNTARVTTPIPLNFDNVATAEPGYYDSFFINTDGELFRMGQTFDAGALIYAPLHIFNTIGVKDIAAPDKFGVYLQEDGSVWCWGGATLGGQYFPTWSLPEHLRDFKTILSFSVFEDSIPSVGLTVPENSSLLVQGNPIEISLSGSSGSRVKRVDFYAEDTLIGKVIEGPWEIKWTPPTWGRFRITAITFDGEGLPLHKASTELEIPFDSDENGVPDWWELRHFQMLGLDPDADADGDGIANLQEYQGGSNPVDFYDRPGGVISASILLVDGDGQVGPPNEFLGNPIVVKVIDELENPIAGAPVDFSVEAGNGGLSVNGEGTNNTSICVVTGSDGQASAYYKQGAQPDVESQIKAKAGRTAEIIVKSYARNLPPIEVTSSQSHVRMLNGERLSVNYVIKNNTSEVLQYGVRFSDELESHRVLPNRGGDGRYSWVSSDELNGPEYVWEDISETGILLDPNDGNYNFYYQTFEMPFAFPFYDEEYSSFSVDASGYIRFSDAGLSGVYSDRLSAGPYYESRLIAAFTKYIRLEKFGSVYYKTFPHKVIVQYEQVESHVGGHRYTFQIVLCENGVIYFYYKRLNGPVLNALVGIQNDAAGFSIRFGEPFLKDSMAIMIVDEKSSWMKFRQSHGELGPGESASVILDLDAGGVLTGDYLREVEFYDRNELVAPIATSLTVEVRVPPTDSDLDGDALPDQWEEMYVGSLDQFERDTSESDGLSNFKKLWDPIIYNDSDGDGYPDAFEIRKGTNIFDPNSRPKEDIVVDVGGTGANGDYKSLGDAFEALYDDFEIILVKPGRYSGDRNIELTNKRKVLVISENGADETIVDNRLVGMSVFTPENDLVLDGFHINNGWIGLSPKRGGKLVNCAISGNLVAVSSESDYPFEFEHCTFFGNDVLDEPIDEFFTMPGAILKNCVVWGNYPNNLSVRNATYSLIQMADPEAVFVGEGNMNEDPLLERGFHLSKGSPARGRAFDHTLLRVDGDREVRQNGDFRRDIGADEYIDMNGNDLVDWWEIKWFGKSNESAGGDFDQDWLVNIEEYRNYTDPTKSDTDGDGMSDGWEIEQGFNPRDVGDQLDDCDGDGVPNYLDADPYNPEVNEISVTILTPEDGSLLQ